MKNKHSQNSKTNLSQTLVLLAVIMGLGFTPAAHAAGVFNVILDSQKTSMGDAINVRVRAENFNGRVSGIDFTVQYNPALLAYTGYTDNALSGYGTLTVGAGTSTVAVNWFDLSALGLDNGELLTLHFMIISGTAAKTELVFTGINELADVYGNPISPVSFVNSVLSLNLRSNLRVPRAFPQVHTDTISNDKLWNFGIPAKFLAGGLNFIQKHLGFWNENSRIN